MEKGIQSLAEILSSEKITYEERNPRRLIGRGDAHPLAEVPHGLTLVCLTSLFEAINDDRRRDREPMASLQVLLGKPATKAMLAKIQEDYSIEEPLVHVSENGNVYAPVAFAIYAAAVTSQRMCFEVCMEYQSKILNM